MLQGYWQAALDPKMKSAVMADWADELEDWPLDQVRWALRKWRAENTSRKPNPAHITAILRAERGKAFAARKEPESEPKGEPRVSKEQATEILKAAGFRIGEHGNVISIGGSDG